jgi:AcrR family transcriptional regulator
MPGSETEAPALRRARYHHGDLAEALAEAARSIIEEVGPARLSLSECCRRAGVSTAAPYKHFRDKEALIRRVAIDGFDTLGAAMRAARDAGAHLAPGPRIAAMGKAYLHFALDRPGVFGLMFGMSGDVHGEDGPELTEAGHDCFAVLIDEVAHALGDAAAAKQVSITLWTFVHGAASLAMDGNYEKAEAPVDLDAMIETATERLLADVARR